MVGREGPVQMGVMMDTYESHPGSHMSPGHPRIDLTASAHSVLLLFLLSESSTGVATGWLAQILPLVPQPAAWIPSLVSIGPSLGSTAST